MMLPNPRFAGCFVTPDAGPLVRPRRLAGSVGWVRALGVCVALTFGPLALGAWADTLILKSGDRISGTIQRRKTTIRLKTPYGRINVKLADVERIVLDDGREVGPDGKALPPRSAKLQLVITGQAFWQAWRRGGAPPDPSLRLELRLDGERAAVWWDRRLDPGEIRGAIVNVFDFDPAETVSTAVEGVESHALDSVPGRVGVELIVPHRLLDRRVVSLVYQVNDGTPEDPQWRDVTGGSAGILLDPDRALRLIVDQAGGHMQYAGFPRKRMKRSETFRVIVRPDLEAPK